MNITDPCKSSLKQDERLVNTETLLKIMYLSTGAKFSFKPLKNGNAVFTDQGYSVRTWKYEALTFAHGHDHHKLGW